jgi:hypothetical protein
LGGSTHNSVVGLNTPRIQNNIDNNAINQVIEIHEIDPVATTMPQINTQYTQHTQPLNANSQQNQNQLPEDDDGIFM